MAPLDPPPASGRAYWRSLEAWGRARGEGAEFAPQASVWEQDLSRRRFLQVMGASIALAGLSACARPARKIIPYVRQPEAVVPGKPLYFATAMPLGGYGAGLLIESHTGRPTKLEGNPEHPASLGAASAIAQAAILGLYDPDRSQSVLHQGKTSNWEQLTQVLAQAMAGQATSSGKGLRILSETVTSPGLSDAVATLLRRYPAARWHQFEPLAASGASEGARLAYGEPLDTHYRLERAKVIVSFEADLLGAGPASLRYARDFAAGRRVSETGGKMNRLYVLEASPSLTGASADHRVPVRPSELPAAIRAIANGLGVPIPAQQQVEPSSLPPGCLAAVVQDLKAHPGESVIVAGDHLPPGDHALVHAMNQTLGNTGKTVILTEPVATRPEEQVLSLGALVEDMRAGAVEVLVILGGNPVYNAPADFAFKEALSKVRHSIHLSLYVDETSASCEWHVPEAHFLEAWGDVRAFDGSASIVQPAIAPLYGGKSALELLAAMLGTSTPDPYDQLRAYWQRQRPKSDFDAFWNTALQAGVIPETAFPPKSLPRSAMVPDFADGSARGEGLEVVFRPDPTVYDGRFANNGWLQELPKPLTQLTWDNSALVSPATATRLSLASGDVVALTIRGRTVEAPVWVMPGHADETVTLPLGYGRTRAGRVGTGVGFDGYALRTSAAMWHDTGLTLRKTGARMALASTQQHHSMDGRDLVREATLSDYHRNPAFASDPVVPLATLYEPPTSKGHKWGMAIDLNACIGCNACMVACQSENNIPVVGKEQVLRHRDMHWIRVDRYHLGAPANPQTLFQPVPCMQCEQAPCEPVCPTAATVHSEEGLNDMAYSRCIGTRYCSNNCPYKVRRFNFLQYADDRTPSLKAMRNPDVTVRSRGVMEKCTYCVQRINAARIDAEVEGRPLRDGEVVTACQATCPTRAIVFGDLNDPTSEISRRKAEPLDYALLAELNTRPRTTYLAKLRNPNPAIEG